MAKYNIDIEKRYKFPYPINVSYYNDSILIISPLTANWIVLKSYDQLCILKFFINGKSISDAFRNPLFKSTDIEYVVTQIEARKFCSKAVTKSTSIGRSMHLYLTNKCNLHCPHCYMFSGKENDNELTTNEIIGLISDYRHIAGGTRLTISGGEPSIRADFLRILEEAYNLGFQVKILSNGSLLSADMVSKMANFINAAQISIDGYSEDTNALIRGKGHFQAALNAVDSLISNGVDTSIAITPPLNLLQSNLTDYANFAKSLMERYSGKSFEVRFAEGLSQGRNIVPSKESNELYATLIKQIQNEIYGGQYELMMFVEKMSNSIVLDNCMFGSFSVSSVGDVYLCPEIYSLRSIGNIRTTSFQEISKKASMAELSTQISMLEPCNKCELMYICGGGCRINEFPDIVKINDFQSIDYSKISPRHCDLSIKEKFYKLMIDSNEYLFSPLSD